MPVGECRRRGRRVPFGVAKKASTSTAGSVTPAKPRPPKVRDFTDAPPSAATIPVPVPMSLESVVGQQKALALLNDAMRSERMHHAWIFHGPSGVGKFTTAVAFAAVVLDPTSEAGLDGSIAPDPESRTQQLLRAGTHPDLHIVVKELAKFHEDARIRDQRLRVIPTEVLRKHLIEPATRSGSLTSKSRATSVFIVDEADLMNASGQNGVLKTLEEPPPGMVIILVTSNESDLLPTIRSRCQRVPFAQLSEKDLRQWANHAKLEFSAESKDFLIAFADGSPGDLVEAIRGDMGAWRTALLPHLSKLMSGKHSVGAAPLMEELCKKWSEDWVDEHENASKELANHMAAGWLLRLVAFEMRKALRLGTPGALEAIDAIRAAEAQLESNLKALFVLDAMCVEIAHGFATAQGR